jgi:hypothetical protein
MTDAPVEDRAPLRRAGLAVLLAWAGVGLVQLDLQLQLRVWDFFAFEYPWLTHFYASWSWAHWVGPTAGLAGWVLLYRPHGVRWVTSPGVLRFVLCWLVLSSAVHLVAMSHANWALVQ